MGCEKLSHELLDLGFFCALGTTERSGLMMGEGRIVTVDTPFRYDYNNGVNVVYDEGGRPWILHGSGMTDEVGEKVSELLRRFNARRGAFVPHSNDGGHFVRKVITEAMTVPVRS